MPEYDDDQKTLIKESNEQYDSENTTQYRLNSTIREFNTVREKARDRFNDTFRSILGDFDDLHKKFTPYKGRPWMEIDRAPAGPIGHFIVYANYKGISSHDIAEMLKNPDSDEAKTTEQRLNDIKDGYFKMLADHDVDEMRNSMVSYCTSVKNDLPKIHGYIKNVDTMQENIYEILALGDIQSFLQQDYVSSPGSKNENLENIEFFAKTNKEVEEKTGVGMDDIYRSLYGVTLVSNKIKGDNLKTEADLKSDIVFDAVAMFTIANVCNETKRIFDEANSLDEGIKEFSKNFKVIQAAGDELYITYVGRSISEVDEKLLALCQSPSYDDRKGANFLEQLNNSKRPFGQLSDSPEFKDIKEKLTKFLDGKKQPLNMDRANLEELKISCEKYLQDRNPKSDEGKARYRLINKVLRYTDDNLARLTKLTNSEAFREDAKKSAKAGLKKTVDYEGVTKDIYKRIESVKKTAERYAASKELQTAKDNVKEFLAQIEDDYDTISRAASKGKELFDDPSGFNQIRAKKAFARVQIYELFRGEFNPNTGQYDGPISKRLRSGGCELLEDMLYDSNFAKMFIDSKQKINNLGEFLDKSPIEYIDLAAKHITKLVKKKQPEPSANADKQIEPSATANKQVKPAEIKPPTA